MMTYDQFTNILTLDAGLRLRPPLTIFPRRIGAVQFTCCYDTPLAVTELIAEWTAPDALTYTASIKVTDEWVAQAWHPHEAREFLEEMILDKLRAQVRQAYSEHPQGWPWAHLTWAEVLTAA